LTIHSHLINVEPVQPIMPVAHITKLRIFEELLSGQPLSLNSSCPKKTKPALYLFYGAPFYKLPHHEPYEMGVDDADQYPIGLLIPSDCLAGISTDVYPFDTGALNHGLYSPVFESDPTIFDDYCTPSTNAPIEAARLVDLMFGTNFAYVKGKLRPNLNDGNDLLGRLCELKQARLKADYRRCAIEIIAYGQLPANWNGMVVIGPKGPMRSLRQRLDFLNTLVLSGDVKILTYNETETFSPTDDCRTILDRAIDWLTERQFILEEP
jgi:hypothetical protein